MATHARAAPQRGGSGARFLAIAGRASRERIVVPVVIGLLMVGMGLFTGSLWPSLQSTLAALPASLTDKLGQALGGSDMTTAAGWMGTEFVSFVVPYGVIAAAVMAGVRSVAAEEQDGTLGVLLSAPVGRTTFLLAKTVAMGAHVVLVCAGVALGLVLGSAVGDLGLEARGIIATVLHAALLGVVFGCVAIVVGAQTGDRRVARTAAAGLAGLSFVLSALLPLIEPLAGLVRLSPWHYFNGANPLANGVAVTDLAVLAAISIVLTTAATVLYGRRDLHG